jgi:CRP-like cAMP-binding protein
MDLRPFLKTLPAFEGFTPAHLDVLSGLMQVAPYPQGHRFIEQGRQGEAMYLLVEGAVEVDRVNEVSGEREEARELRAGEMFGLLSLVDNLPAGATCVAKEPVIAAALSRAAFQQLFQSAPPIAHHLQYMVAVQLARDLQERNKALRQLLKRRAAAAA